MEELGDNMSSTVFNIADDGDIILVVGSEQMKLRVYSLFLKAVSKPFSAMFGPNWKEGHSILGRDGPVELPLPEDNATALKVICNIIHHQNQHVPQNLAVGDVLGIAVTAHKYDCVNALKFASGNWLQPCKNKAADLMLLTTAAYLFQNAQAFQEITQALILDHGGPYLTLLREEVESAMPWRVFCLLEEQRSFVRLKLAEILIRGINDATGLCVHKCGWSSKYAYAYLNLLERRKLWPTHLLCISKAIDIAEKMPDPVPEESSDSCVYSYKHCAPEYRINRRRELANLNDDIGLCLHCVQSGSTTSSYCRKKH